MTQVMPENTFLQLDRCGAGLRLTVRDGDHRQAPEVATLVRQPYYNDDGWDKVMREWLGHQRVFHDTPVHAWTEHQHLGTVIDLVEGRIDVDAIRG